MLYARTTSTREAAFICSYKLNLDRCSLLVDLVHIVFFLYLDISDSAQALQGRFQVGDGRAPGRHRVGRPLSKGDCEGGCACDVEAAVEGARQALPLEFGGAENGRPVLCVSVHGVGVFKPKGYGW